MARLNAADADLLGRDVTLGVLPLGTGNDFARSLGIPPSLEAACDVIAAGYTARVDVGLANGRPFLNAASLGLATAIARRLTPAPQARAGKLAYPVAAVAELWEHQPFHVRMTDRPRRAGAGRAAARGGQRALPRRGQHGDARCHAR